MGGAYTPAKLQQRLMKNMKILLSGALLLMVTFLSAQSGVEAFGFNDLSKIKVEELTDGQISALMQKVNNSGYTTSQLEALGRARGMSTEQIDKLKGRIALLERTQPSDRLAGISRLREKPSLPLDRPDTKEEVTEAPNHLEVFGMKFFKNRDLSFEPNFNMPTPENYALGTGDELVIDIWGASEQTYRATISPEGAIRIPNLGPLYLHGKTIAEARQLIMKRLKSIYSTLGTSTFGEISLGQLKTVQVNIVGEVAVPGTYAVSSFSTIYNALYLAGGTTQSGSLRTIRLYRQGNVIEEVDFYDYLFHARTSNEILRDQDIIMVCPYEIQVEVSGEVKCPGIFEMKPGETLEDLMRFTGGFTKEAFQSSLTISRINQIQRKILTVSYDDLPHVVIKNGDKVFVRSILDRYENRVHIEGAVLMPGQYQWVPGMTVGALIQMAYGLEQDAFAELGIILRVGEDNSLENIPFSVQEVVSGVSDIALQPDDYLKIHSKFDLQADYQVRISGEVRVPGEVPYIESMTVEDLIYLAGGFKETAARSYVEIVRQKRRGVAETEDIPNDLVKLFTLPINENLGLTREGKEFYLKPFDVVMVRKSPEYRKPEFVQVEGEVKHSGEYALKNKEERISDLIARVGGLTKYGDPKGTVLIRNTHPADTKERDEKAPLIKWAKIQTILEEDSLVENAHKLARQESIGLDLDKILRSPGSVEDLILEDGDILYVPPKNQTVSIQGEVLHASVVSYDPGKNFRDFISNAGGYSANAWPSRTFVVSANGTVEKTRRFLWFKNYPDVEPGAQIIIPKKKITREMSFIEVFGLINGASGLAALLFTLAR